MTDKVTRRDRFQRVFLKIADELVAQLAKENLPKEVLEWYRKNLDYNVPHGKLYRGMSVVDTVETIKRRPLLDEEYVKAAVLGWCIEFLQAYLLVADDIMDGSITRRGRPCWYRVPGTGMVAVNDAQMLKTAIFRLLKTYFKGDPCYVDLLDLFLEMSYNTEVGQLMDLIFAPAEVNLDKFSLENFHFIATYKTAFYSSYLPVACSMLMCGIPNTPIPNSTSNEPARSQYDIAKSILLPIGECFQVYDDFIDYIGNPERTGKIGTDIINNKCSWCINTALSHASPTQRRILEENYGVGSSGGESELKVKAVYDEIGLKEKYAAYEDHVSTWIQAKINEVPELEGSDILTGEVLRHFFAKFSKLYEKIN